MQEGRLEGALDLPQGARKGRLVVALDAEKGLAAGVALGAGRGG